MRKMKVYIALQDPITGSLHVATTTQHLSSGVRLGRLSDHAKLTAASSDCDVDAGNNSYEAAYMSSAKRCKTSDS